MVTSNIDTLVAEVHTLMAQSDKCKKVSINNAMGIPTHSHKGFSEHIIIEFSLKKCYLELVGGEGSRDPGLGELGPCKGHDT